MKKLTEFDLLEDLAKLIKKYGPEPFYNLARTMSEPDFLQSLISVLNQTIKYSRDLEFAYPSNGGKPKVEPTLQKVLQAVMHEDVEKYNLLQQILSDLRTGQILPTMKDVRDFANQYSLSNVDRGSRQKSIGPLIRALAKLSTEEIKRKGKLFSKEENQLSDLESWSNLILQSSDKKIDKE